MCIASPVFGHNAHGVDCPKSMDAQLDDVAVYLVSLFGNDEWFPLQPRIGIAVSYGRGNSSMKAHLLTPSYDSRPFPQSLTRVEPRPRYRDQAARLVSSNLGRYEGSIPATTSNFLFQVSPYSIHPFHV